MQYWPSPCVGQILILYFNFLYAAHSNPIIILQVGSVMLALTVRTNRKW